MKSIKDDTWCNSYLSGYECVLWRGTPLPGKLLSRKDIFLVPFSLMWLAIVVFCEAVILYTGAPFFAKLWCVPFILIGLYIAFGRFFYIAYTRKRTAYVITNKKVLRLRKHTVDILSGDKRFQMRIRAYADGSGTITFTETGIYRRSPTWGDDSSVFSLIHIENVERVRQIILSTENSSIQ